VELSLSGEIVVKTGEQAGEQADLTILIVLIMEQETPQQLHLPKDLEEDVHHLDLSLVLLQVLEEEVLELLEEIQFVYPVLLVQLEMEE
jgi:hypothetical protein